MENVHPRNFTVLFDSSRHLNRTVLLHGQMGVSPCWESLRVGSLSVLGEPLG